MIIAPRCNATCVRPFRPLRHCEFHTGWNRPFWMKLEDPLTLSLSPKGEGTFAQRSELLLQDRSKALSSSKTSRLSACWRRRVF